jgi:hypothetical protein
VSKLNQGLIGLLVVQLLVLVGTSFGEGRARLALSEPVEILPGLEPAKVEKLTIYGPSEDGEGQEQVTLARAGDGWVIPGADDFPAKGEEVDNLLSTLAELRSRNEVLTGSTYHEKLKVAADAYRRRIELVMGGETTTLFMGTSPSFKSLHVRREGADSVYQVDGVSESDAGARAWSWVDRTYVKYPKDEVWSVTVKNEHGTLQLDRDPTSDTWAALGVEGDLDTTAVEGLVNDARDIGLEAPVGKTEEDAYALGEAATVTLVTGSSTVAGAPPKETETVTIRVGDEVEGKKRRYVKASTSEYVVEAAAFEVKKLVETKRADLEAEDEDEDAASSGAPAKTPKAPAPAKTPKKPAPADQPESGGTDAEEAGAPEATPETTEAELEAPEATSEAPEADPKAPEGDPKAPGASSEATEADPEGTESDAEPDADEAQEEDDDD